MPTVDIHSQVQTFSILQFSLMHILFTLVHFHLNAIHVAVPRLHENLTS